MSIFISQQVKTITDNTRPTFRITNANNKTLTIKDASDNVIRAAPVDLSDDVEQEIFVSDSVFFGR